MTDMQTPKDPRDPRELIQVTLAAVLSALIISLALQFLVVGPALQLQLMERAKNTEVLRQRLDNKEIEISKLREDIAIFEELFKMKAEDRWKGTWMELWALDLGAKNPDMIVPNPKDYRRD